MDQIKASKKVLADSQKVKFPYTISAFGLKIVVRPKVFSPKHFHGWKIFTRNFPNVKNKDVVEIGCGVGVTALYLAKNAANRVLALDINPHAVKNTKENAAKNKIGNIEVRKSDIFSAIKRDERFDIIYWNTPFMYAPVNYKYRSVLERGLFDPGYKITEKFLREAKKILKPKGKVLFGTGDFGDILRFKKLAKKYNYTVKLIAKEKSTEINPVVFELYELKPKKS